MDDDIDHNQVILNKKLETIYYNIMICQQVMCDVTYNIAMCSVIKSLSCVRCSSENIKVSLCDLDTLDDYVSTYDILASNMLMYTLTMGVLEYGIHLQ